LIVVPAQADWSLFLGATRNGTTVEANLQTDSEISRLGQNNRVLKYNPKADAKSRYKQADDDFEILVMRCQRIYNNNS